MRIKRAWNATLRSLPSDDTFLGVTIFTGVIVMCSGKSLGGDFPPAVRHSNTRVLIRFVGSIITNANISTTTVREVKSDVGFIQV